MGARVCNPSTQEAEAGRWQVKVSLGYLVICEASLDYTARLCLKNKLKLSVQCLLSLRDPLKRTESDAKVKQHRGRRRLSGEPSPCLSAKSHTVPDVPGQKERPGRSQRYHWPSGPPYSVPEVPSRLMLCPQSQQPPLSSVMVE